MSDSRTSLLNRIKALQAKTVTNGCTEAEALSATVMVGRLMDQHGFSTFDLQVEEREVILKDTYLFKGKKVGAVSACAVRIADFCDVRVWVDRKDDAAKINFFGRESDVAVACYLTHLLQTSFESEWRVFQATPEYTSSQAHGRTLHVHFDVGMSRRLNTRLMELKQNRNRAVDPNNAARTGSSLVVVKSKEVATAFAALGLRLKRSAGRGVSISGHTAGAYAAGQAAGSRVSITNGVGGSQARRICA